MFYRVAILPLLLAQILTFGCSMQGNQDRIDAITIEVTGDNFNWYFRYPGPDGELGTADDRFSTKDLYLPDNADVKLELNSKDYIYTLEIPPLGVKEVAVPDLDFGMKFSTLGEQSWELLGGQFCGYTHDSLKGRVYVRDQSMTGFYEWDSR